jgi:hypothetical protein
LWNFYELKISPTKKEKEKEKERKKPITKIPDYLTT